MSQFQAPKGVRDILPAEAARWQQLEAVFARLCGQAGYGEYRAPMFEELEVFARLGESTEVVSKEMYDFVDKGGRRFALRPELTASAARAFIQHNPAAPWKIYYLGPQFRYERPQAGRQRQFSQAGIEALGASDPYLDAEVIALGWRFLSELDLRQLRLVINSLGDADTKAAYAQQLGDFFAQHEDQLSETSSNTAKTNPFRVLDSKRPEDQLVIAQAPSILEALSDADAARFEQVRAGLDTLKIPYEVNPRLVRGLDYYTQTAFEFVSDAFGGAQNALGGGGHYDGLVEALGGKPAAGVGFAMGIDRILQACDAEQTFVPAGTAVDVFVVDVTGGQAALELTHELRQAGISCDRAWENRSMKAQMKLADRSQARFAAIIGATEQDTNTVTLRDLRGGDAAEPQAAIPRDELVSTLQARIQP